MGSSSFGINNLLQGLVCAIGLTYGGLYFLRDGTQRPSEYVPIDLHTAKSTYSDTPRSIEGKITVGFIADGIKDRKGYFVLPDGMLMESHDRLGSGAIFAIYDAKDTIRCQASHIDGSMIRARRDNDLSLDSILNVRGPVLDASVKNKDVIVKGKLSRGIMHAYEIEIDGINYVLLKN